jgi:hypothetical protein
VSDATDLKQRFALVRLRTGKSAELDQLIKRCAWSKAQELGLAMGLPVSTRVVIDIQSRRPRT